MLNGDKIRDGSDGGGGRMTQRCALRPSGRCLRQRFLARTERYKALCLTGIRYATEVMVVGEGLLSAARFALRVVACGNAFSLRSNRTLVEASHPSRTERYKALCLAGIRYATEVMVVGEGFEPSKSMTADLQSAPFGRSGTPPGVIQIVGKA